MLCLYKNDTVLKQPIPYVLIDIHSLFHTLTIFVFDNGISNTRKYDQRNEFRIRLYQVSIQSRNNH